MLTHAVGDTVWLGSGGPKMLVVAPSLRPAEWMCEWEGHDGALQQSFLDVCLVSKDPDGPDELRKVMSAGGD